MRRLYVWLSGGDADADMLQGITWAGWYLSLMALIGHMLGHKVAVPSYAVAAVVVAYLLKTVVTRWNHRRIDRLMQSFVDQPLLHGGGYEQTVAAGEVWLKLVQHSEKDAVVVAFPATEANALTLQRTAHGLLNLGRYNLREAQRHCQSLEGALCGGIDSNYIRYSITDPGRQYGSMYVGKLYGLTTANEIARKVNQARSRRQWLKSPEYAAAKKAREEAARRKNERLRLVNEWLERQLWGCLSLAWLPVVLLFKLVFAPYRMVRTRQKQRQEVAAQVIVARGPSHVNEDSLSRVEPDETANGLFRLGPESDETLLEQGV